jgi:putative membrane protein insertion efficiency factor
VRALLVGLLRLYKLVVSPLLPPACRFSPTCSEYAIEAIAEHGALRGSWLALRRLGRCHPWHPGGIDLVPPQCAPRIGDPVARTGAPVLLTCAPPSGNAAGAPR